MTELVGRRITKLPVFTLSNDHQVAITLHEVRGSGAGPTLGLVAGLHGDEPLSIEIVRRIVTETNPAGLRGSILAISVANPYAYQALVRNSPLDMSNLNRIFPGDRNGLLSEQLAHVISVQFLPRCNYLIDLHSGGNLATVDYVYIPDESGTDLAKSYSCEIIYRGVPPPGSIAEYAGKQGIPSIMSELGGGQAANNHFIDKGVRGVNNILKHLRMCDGDPQLPANRVMVKELVTLRPQNGGFMYSNVRVGQLGTSVAKGSVLGRIVSPYSFDALEEMTAPFDPSILVLLRESITKVDPGDYGFMVANGASAQAI